MGRKVERRGVGVLAITVDGKKGREEGGGGGGSSHPSLLMGRLVNVTGLGSDNYFQYHSSLVRVVPGFTVPLTYSTHGESLGTRQ